MKKLIGGILNKILKKFNLQLLLISTNKNGHCMDIENDKEFMDLYSFCAPFTMTSLERMYSLYNSVKHVIENNIEGDFVECGVWKGGSSMLIARYLQSKNIQDRKIYLYDTFEGMNEPTDDDFDYKGNLAMNSFSELSTGEDSSDWCFAPIDEVKQNMLKTGLKEENIILTKGKVEDTIPKTLPEDKIALLRLDTDWYDSTKHELIHLYPMLIENGVLIIDDFGHWEGAKKAVIEYFTESKQHLLLNRIDYTGRIGIKTSHNINVPTL